MEDQDAQLKAQVELSQQRVLHEANKVLLQQAKNNMTEYVSEMEPIIEALNDLIELNINYKSEATEGNKIFVDIEN